MKRRKIIIDFTNTIDLIKTYFDPDLYTDDVKLEKDLNWLLSEIYSSGYQAGEDTKEYKNEIIRGL